jgi:hypothetical protein
MSEAQLHSGRFGFPHRLTNGVESMAFMDTALKSAKAEGAWTKRLLKSAHHGQGCTLKTLQSSFASVEFQLDCL